QNPDRRCSGEDRHGRNPRSERRPLGNDRARGRHVTGRAPVWLWIVFLAACAAVASQARFTTDLSAFLPRLPTPEQRILVDQLREGVVSQVVLIALQAAPQDKLALMSNALAERLAQAPEFAYASNGAQERVEADGKFLLAHRYVLSPGVRAERFTVD